MISLSFCFMGDGLPFIDNSISIIVNYYLSYFDKYHGEMHLADFFRNKPYGPAASRTRAATGADSSRPSASSWARGLILRQLLRTISTNFSRVYSVCCAAKASISLSRKTSTAASSRAWVPGLVLSPVFETQVAASAASSAGTPAERRSCRARSACFV